MKQIDNLYQLTPSDEGSYIRLDGLAGKLAYQKPTKSACYRIVKVWADGGLNLRKYGLPRFVKSSFLSTHKMNQRAEIYTTAEIEGLPE